MPFQTNEQDQVVVIDIKGKFLGSIEGPGFKDTIDRLKQEGKTHVVIDLAQADLMDSSGIGALISALTSMRKAGGDVRLANLKKRIRNIFLMTRLLGQVFKDYDSLDEAVTSFDNDPPEPAEEEDE